MAYSAELAERIRLHLASRTDVTERGMFGGRSFVVNGNMAVGVIGDDLVVRASPAESETLLAKPHVRPMDFTGRPMKAWLYVAPEGTSGEHALRGWIAVGLQYALSLPAKGSAPPAKKR